ncbi:hypothetical protein ACFCX4_06385 [Kitasatospora sp. NPDC056327]|uniref:hypothetical protein n=1 Tax=Kitasatospora sp. NPDC056327 TaxID=3345785 RepID=UPI0035D98FBC
MHRRCLDLTAGAVEQASGPEAVPGSEGELVDELRYLLDGAAVLGAVAKSSPRS